MTTEQKAKRYDEAIERARKLKENPKAIFFEEENVHVSDYIFPELAESKDEKIRKEIKVILANTDFSQFALDYTFADMIAWLEKQKSSFDINEVCKWLQDYVKYYVNGEYNEFHHCIEYGVNTDSLIKDLKDVFK